MSINMLRKALATVSALAIAFTAVVVPSVPAVSAQSLWWEAYNNALFELGVVDSTGTGFRAGDNVNRAELAAMISRAGGFDEDGAPDPGFADVTPADWYYGPVAALKDAGVVSGQGGGTTYDPAGVVTRAAAAKMIALAFDITSDGGTVPFTDVSTSDWFYPYVRDIYMNSVVDGQGGGNTFDPGAPITRAAMSKLLSLGLVVADSLPGEYVRFDDGASAFADFTAEEIVALVTGGEIAQPPVDEPGVPGPSNASFSVNVASDNPMAANIPQNGFNVPYSYITFTAGSQEGVRIESLVITRTGLGASSNFTSVKLYLGNTQVGSEKTLSSQHNIATFNLSGSPITVPAGTSKTVRVLADMNSPGSGVSNQLGIASAADVTAVGMQTGGAVTVGGNFPVFGNLMTTSAATVGTISYQITDPHGVGNATTFYIGDQDRVFTRILIQGGTEDMDLASITFRNEGSATPDEVANIALYQGATLISGPTQMSDRFVTLEFATPFFIERGNSVTFELRGDIVGGYNHTVGFDIYRDWHINAIGRVYGFPIRVSEAAQSQSITSDNITGSRVSVALGAANPTTGDVAPNAKDFGFIQFNIVNTGDAISIRNLPFAVIPALGSSAADLSDVKIWELDATGQPVRVVAGPVEPVTTVANTSEKVIFTDEFEVPTNTTGHYLLTADVSNSAVAAETFTVDLLNPDGSLVAAGLGVGAGATSGFEIKNISTNDIIYNNATIGQATGISMELVGNTRTVANPSLAFSVSTSPATDAYVKNASNIPVTGFDVKAGSADDVSLTALTLTLRNNNAGAARGLNCAVPVGGAGVPSANDLARVKLYSLIGGTETLLDGPREVSTNLSTNFTGFNLLVPKGETVKILARADLPSGAQNLVCVGLGIAAATDVTANDSNGRTLATASQILDGAGAVLANVNGAAGAATSFVLVAQSGRLNVSVDNTTPVARQVIAGATGVDVAVLKFEATTVEDVKVERLRLYNVGGGDRAVASVDLYDGDLKLATGSLNANGYVSWENLNIVVPRNDNKMITVKVNFNNSAAIVDIAGLAPRFVIRNLEDDWVDGATAVAPNGTANNAGSTGDIKAIGKQSGAQLINGIAGTDAILGDLGDGGNVCDSVGNVTGTVTVACVAGAGGPTFTGNTLTKSQYVYNTRLALSLATTNPTGSQGAASSSQKDVFRFTISAAANPTANNPRQAILQYVYLTVSGDAEGTSFQLFGPNDNYTSPIATSNVVHRTNTVGNDGNAAAEHTARTTVIPFFLSGADSRVSYGGSKTYLVKSNVSALTSTDFPTRSLLFSIFDYGSATGGADVIWLDNGTTTENGNTAAVRWIYDETGKTKLEPSTPLSYTGSSFIIADNTAAVTATSTDSAATPVITAVAARTVSATSVRVFYSLPIELAPFTDYAVDPTGAAGAVANVATTASSVNGNLVTLTAPAATMVTNTDGDVDYSAVTGTLVLGSAAAGTGAPTVLYADATAVAGF